jgi:hypothetical protein
MDRYEGLKHLDVSGVDLVYLFMNFVTLFHQKRGGSAALRKGVFVLVPPDLKSSC